MFRDAPFLRAFLPYALAQARRRHEPLSLFYVSVDRLAAIRELHGPEIAAAAVERVAETMVQALRASDVVARLDDGRLIAVLPYADHEDAPAVAEAVRAAIASSGVASRTMPVLTASIGVASYPAQRPRPRLPEPGRLRRAHPRARPRARPGRPVEGEGRHPDIGDRPVNRPAPQAPRRGLLGTRGSEAR